jgi:hypothetical protein
MASDSGGKHGQLVRCWPGGAPSSRQAEERGREDVEHLGECQRVGEAQGSTAREQDEAPAHGGAGLTTSSGCARSPLG